MKAFKRSKGLFVAEFEPEEAQMLTALANQVGEILEQRDEADAAVARLLPDAYPDDAEATAEFKRFTADGLAERKVANAGQIVRDLLDASAAASTTKVSLGVQSSQAWLRSLTDIRLTIASRLGIENDADVNNDSVDNEDGTFDPVLFDLYDWLGFVQGSLIDAVDR